MECGLCLCATNTDAAGSTTPSSFVGDLFTVQAESHWKHMFGSVTLAMVTQPTDTEVSA